MKIQALMIIIALLVGSVCVHAQDKNELYNGAVQAFNQQKFDKVIENGEKLATVEGLPKKNRLSLYLMLANSYLATKLNLNKSVEYAGKLKDLALEMKAADNNSKRYDKRHVVPALRIQVKALYELGKSDVEMLKKAVATSVEIFKNYDKSSKSSNLLLSVANKLFRKGGKAEAIAALKVVCDDETKKPSGKALNTLAAWYSKNKDKKSAAMYLRKAYAKRKNPKTAYNLAVMIKDSDLDGAIGFLAEAFIMKKENKNSKEYKTLRHLVYNVKGKGKTQEEMDAFLNKAIADAKGRV